MVKLEKSDAKLEKLHRTYFVFNVSDWHFRLLV